MRELVGTCKDCGKLVFCENGFLNGFLSEDKSLLCTECDEKSKTAPGDAPPAVN